MIQDIYPHIYSPDFARPVAEGTDSVFVFESKKNLLLARFADEKLFFPTVGEIDCENADLIFLFTVDGKNYFMLKKYIEPFGEYEYIEAQSLRQTKPMWKSFAAITAVQLGRWYKNNRFCSGCGRHMKLSTKERALVCEECGKTVYPTISPSVIVAVTNGDKILLTKYAPSHSSHNRYALVAGYIEIGETPEDTVRREVMEEVGLRVKNIKYYKSQPWSFSDSLLLGFSCEVDGSDEITLEENELSFAGWFTKEEIPENPSKISLTNEMIQRFKNGEAF